MLGETSTLFDYESFPKSWKGDLLQKVEVWDELLNLFMSKDVITNFLFGTWSVFNFLWDWAWVGGLCFLTSDTWTSLKFLTSFESDPYIWKGGLTFVTTHVGLVFFLPRCGNSSLLLPQSKSSFPNPRSSMATASIFTTLSLSKVLSTYSHVCLDLLAACSPTWMMGASTTYSFVSMVISTTY